MRHRLSALALAAAATTFAAASARAEVSLYGQFDVAADHIKKSGGNSAGTLFPAAPDRAITRVSPSLSSPSKLGFRGTEPLGGGYAGRFQMEMSLVPDTGTLGGDGRTWGRMVWVGLTTPVGELRLGRQASPMLAAFDLTTTERLGSTDLSGAGLVVNSLQMYQDNAISYGGKTGPWLGILQFSPNAGVADAVSAGRNGAPAVPPGSGQILGGGSSGTENQDQRGRSLGAMLSYADEEVALAASVHHNRFNVPVNLGLSPLQLFSRAESYTGAMVAAKVRVPTWGTTLGANFHVGETKEAGTLDPKTSAFSVGLRQRVGGFELVAQAAQVEFTNFTQGRDRAVMFGADYDFSKRTAMFVRAGSAKDSRGNVTPVAGGAVSVAGGPMALLVPVGFSEIPVFSGVGLNLDGRTDIVAVGLRHSF
jgi:predicted porin